MSFAFLLVGMDRANKLLGFLAHNQGFMYVLPLRCTKEGRGISGCSHESEHPMGIGALL